MEAVFPVNGSMTRTDPSFCRQHKIPAKPANNKHNTNQHGVVATIVFAAVPSIERNLREGQAMMAGIQKLLMLLLLCLLWLSLFMAAIQSKGEYVLEGATTLEKLKTRRCEGWHEKATRLGEE